MLPLISLPEQTFTAFSRDVNCRVDELLVYLQRSPSAVCHRLNQAMAYVLNNGGKRFRPLLMYATGAALECELGKLDPAALAIELMHTYSLVHDDLPSMDNDDLRRGIPTCHKAFDEATAILVGDALQTLAFEVLSDDQWLIDQGWAHSIGASQKLAQISGLAKACGRSGLVAGQSLDLLSEGETVDLNALVRIHSNKTGRLIEAAINMAVIAAGFAGTEQQRLLEKYSQKVGLSFQIQDDILDVTGTTAEIGKFAGADEQLNKATFPALMGLDCARQRIHELHEESLALLSGFGEKADLLRALSEFTMNRVK